MLLSIVVVMYKTMLSTIPNADASLFHIFIFQLLASRLSSLSISNRYYHAVENSAEMISRGQLEETSIILIFVQ